MRLLDRMILRELLRSGALTTGVLVTVIAFGAAIKPLSDDALFTVGQVATYITLAMVPMLQFALPFAAGFASTMSLHRMAQDNEVVATAASGISPRRVLAPVLALGVVLMLAMVLLTQFAIPVFWVQLQRTVARDVAVLFERTIGAGEPFVLGDLQVWADRIVPEPPENLPEGADARLRLYNVAVADVAADGRVATDVTASQVAIDVYRRPGETILSLRMGEAVAFRPADGMLAWMERPEAAMIRIPTDLRDSPKRMTLPELFDLMETPDGHNRIRGVRRELAEAMRLQDAVTDLGDRLDATGVAELTSRTAGTFRIENARRDGMQLLPRTGRTIVIRQAEGGADRRIFEAASARLSEDPGAGLGTVTSGLTVGEPERPEDLRLQLELTDVAWYDADDPSNRNLREIVPFDALRLPGFDDRSILEASTAELAGLIESRDYPASILALQDRLGEFIEALRREIRARMMSRFATSATAPLLLLLGATLAMWRRGDTPLTIYLYAFLPSVLDLIVISSGEQLVRDGAVVAGMILMWAGNTVLLGFIGFAFYKLSRN
jgi:lipopolysaccharide export system permease protein